MHVFCNVCCFPQPLSYEAIWAWVPRYTRMVALLQASSGGETSLILCWRKRDGCTRCTGCLRQTRRSNTGCLAEAAASGMEAVFPPKKNRTNYKRLRSLPHGDPRKRHAEPSCGITHTHCSRCHNPTALLCHTHAPHADARATHQRVRQMTSAAHARTLRQAHSVRRQAHSPQWSCR